MVKINNKKKQVKRPSGYSMDSVFILKLALFLILGSQWVYIFNSDGSNQIPIPVGALIGLGFALHEHFKIDRKIEYALLLVAMFLGFWAQIGVAIVR